LLRAEAGVAIVPAEVRQRIAIRALPDIERRSQNRPGPRRVVGLSAIAAFFARAYASDVLVVVAVLQVEVQPQGWSGPRPKPDKARVFVNGKLVDIAFEVEEVGENAVAIPQSGPRSENCRRIPGQLGLISLEILVERRVVESRDRHRDRHRWAESRGCKKGACTGWSC